MKQQQRFWEVDLIELVKTWAEDMKTFLLTVLLFLGLSLPVVIPTLILWYLSSINFRAVGGMTLAP